MKNVRDVLPIIIVVLFLLLVTLSWISVRHREQLNEQQCQINQLSLATIAWVRSQNPANEGTLVIKAGTVYDLYFADFNNETAVLTSRKSDSEGHKQTEYTIVHGVPSKLLEEWCKNPHDVQ